MPTLYTGTRYFGSISAAQEKDYYTISLIQDLTYIFKADPDNLGGQPLNDSFLALYTAGGTLLATDDDSGIGNAAKLTYTTNTTANYILQVNGYQSTTGDYILSSSVGYGSQGGDSIVGTASNDMVDGRGGNDVILGQGGNDRLWGNDGNDTMGGASGLDQLRGGAGSDFLGGGADADILRGGDQMDTLVGGSGADNLGGGLGADRFVFEEWSHSTSGQFDKIFASEGAPAFEGAGVAGGDLIDLSGIDADETVAGNQAFTWGNIERGGLRVINYGSWTVVQGNVDNDPTAEFALYIADGNQTASAYYSGDFVL
ncbi:calcium-binding protein [Paracoccus pacificus]|uniref:Calcium-binding protein n=1 Tax=Paracoccus pacificus TaxID=1463598 RepID=A0ABW4R717_9RHOB